MANSKAVAKKAESALTKPGAYGDLSGMGYENQTGADIAVPFMTVLQPLSPQVSDETVKGAKAGAIFNTVTQEIYTQPVIVVPVYTERLFVEWVPRDAGGGFVAVHAPDSDIVSAARAASTEFGRYKHGDNDLVETFYMYVLRMDDVNDLTHAEFAVIAFKSTQIKVYKRLMTTLRTIKSQPPIFAHRVALSTRKDKNDKGTWYSWVANPAVGENAVAAMIPPVHDDAPHPLLMEGKEAREMVMNGLARADFSTQNAAAADADADDGEDTPF